MPEFQDAQSALGFVRSQTQNIEAEVYRVEYPEYNYASLVDVVTEGNGWASGTTFYSMDTVGTTDWIGAEANDVPYTELLHGTGEKSFHTRAGAYRWNITELNMAMMLGRPLASEKAEGVRNIMERFLFDLAISGNQEKAMTGLINDPGVTAGDVAANGTGSVTWWAQKTPDQIVADIALGFDAIRNSTLTVETPDHLLLPDPVRSALGVRRISTGGDGGMSVLQYIQEAFTRTYGRPFVIEGLRQLNNADPGGDGRAVLYSKRRQVARFHLPLPFRFLPPHEKNSFQTEQVGIVRTGGTEIRLKKAMAYLDGIWDAP